MNVFLFSLFSSVSQKISLFCFFFLLLSASS